ncbi:hypothetical protein [Novosphingobium sp. EMRT-2]|uniref:hypothetical protein n=1 Tax=Novosphingobium sp. EMRT-2 TaxID=2571749 RepID=UPI0010BD8894|nr:hypothetical protein [Novosphingobium sp. EMRT-2]QCI92567.1 hypothetical protein FA702_02690 [Novosphingobium sp. EMRT-2]
MKALWIAGLLSGAGLATPAVATAQVAPDHVEHIEHRGGIVEARYQVVTQTVQRQVGAPGPGGRMASLRCVWSVDLTVRREARLPSGALASRQLERPRVLTGTRAGWCKGQESAIAGEVARRTDRLRAEMLAAAQEDRQEVIADAERLHAGHREG